MARLRHALTNHWCPQAVDLSFVEGRLARDGDDARAALRRLSALADTGCVRVKLTPNFLDEAMAFLTHMSERHGGR